MARIKLKGFLSIRDAIGGNGEVDLELPNPTVRKVLTQLSHMYGDEMRLLIFDPVTNDVNPINQILVNGRHYRHLKDRLDAALSDGDMIAVFPAVLGG